MASHCYLVGPPGELFVEYLVRHCALSDLKRDVVEGSKDYFGSTSSYHPYSYKKVEVCSVLKMHKIFCLTAVCIYALLYVVNQLHF